MRSLNLCLHTGGQTVERQQVADVATPSPAGIWYPIPHTQLLDQVEKTIESNGLKIVNQSHALARDGNRYFGLLQLEGRDDDFATVVGLRNSHDKSFPAGLCLGAAVFVCDNLAFTGEINLSRKHTLRIVQDLPQLVNRGLGRLLTVRGRHEKRVESYKTHECDEKTANDLIVRAALDAKAIAPSSIPDVVKRWREPTHPEFKASNVWRLYNAFTENGKGTALNTLVKRSESLHGLLDSHVGIPWDELPGLNLAELPADAEEVVRSAV